MNQSIIITREQAEFLQHVDFEHRPLNDSINSQLNSNSIQEEFQMLEACAWLEGDDKVLKLDAVIGFFKAIGVEVE